MGKITFGVYSTYRSQLGGGLPVKNYETHSKNESEDNSQVEPLFPAGFGLSEQSNIQDNTGVELLLPAGMRMTNNVATDIDIRSKLGEACRIEFQGSGELIDILDSKSFTFEKTDFEGIKHLYSATYSINDNGVLNVNWISARHLEDRINANGASPMFPPKNY